MCEGGNFKGDKAPEKERKIEVGAVKERNEWQCRAENRGTVEGVKKNKVKNGEFLQG